jgi:predicted DNA-binding protein with PD1-like motif
MEAFMEESLLEGVGSGGIQRIVIARIKSGVDLLEGLHEVVRREAIEKGVFITAVGGLQRAAFRTLKQLPRELPVTDEDRLYLDVDRPLELLSLTGHVSPKENGEPNIHAHFSACTVRDDTVVTLGGHLIKGTITAMKVAVAIAVVEGIPMKSIFSSRGKSEELVIE